MGQIVPTMLSKFLPLFLILFLAACNSHSNSGKLQAALQKTSLDQHLSQAATEALGNRAGSVIVLDAQTAEIKVVINTEMAWQTAYPVGSVLKPFLSEAMLEEGHLDPTELHYCNGLWKLGKSGFKCTHLPEKEPFALSKAIAISCNSYFAKHSQHSDLLSFREFLHQKGFGQLTRINSPHESAGRLLPTATSPEDLANIALGESEQISTTPLGLGLSFLSLLTNSPRLVPSIGEERSVQEIKEVKLTKAVVEGLRGCFEYGTAASEPKLPLLVLGKTGSPTIPKDAKTHGWFVGTVVKEEGQKILPEILVVVFLKVGRGREAADVARKIFQAYNNFNREKLDQERIDIKVSLFDPLHPIELSLWSETSVKIVEEETEKLIQEIAPKTSVNISYQPNSELRLKKSLETATKIASAVKVISHSNIKVRVPDAAERVFGKTLVVRADKKRKSLLILELLPFEDYIAGVVAAEMPEEKELEALRAQAVAIRSFANSSLINSNGRHSNEGFAFCSSTHCQRYVGVGDIAIFPRAKNATFSTKNQVILDFSGKVVAALFHPCCGGQTIPAEYIWPKNELEQVKEFRVENPTCAKHGDWEKEVDLQKLSAGIEAFLHSPARNSEIVAIKIQQKDPSGKILKLILEQSSGRQIYFSIGDFITIVQRTFGSSACLSLPNEVFIKNSRVILRGKGFGHSAGLCQHTAHHLAATGKSMNEILLHFFPKTTVEQSTQKLFTQKKDSPNQTYKNRVALIEYNSPNSLADAQEVANIVDTICKEFGKLVKIEEMLPIKIKLHTSTKNFIEETGLAGDSAGATSHSAIHLQPVKLLHQRKILSQTLRHEFTHYVINQIGGENVARWFQEGVAVYYSGEAAALQNSARVENFSSDQLLNPNKLECQLIKAKSLKDRQLLYFAAYRLVRKIIESSGEPAIWQQLQKGKYKSPGC
ncbi:MAG: SpoIID/LytB domain-containing protein [Blastocatellia bacterium]|nr:SpoIID/LytB domain-containing protein [Blastocatellia bacterium]